MEIELATLEWIRGFAGQYFWLDFLGHFLGRFLPFGLIIFLFLLFLSDFKRFGPPFGWGILIGFLTRGLIEPIRRQVFRVRPFVELNLDPIIDAGAESPSFPSAHAAFFFGLSTVVFYYSKKLGLFFYGASFLIVISRIYSAVHWPLDVLAGALIGLAAGLVFQKVIDYFKQKK